MGVLCPHETPAAYGQAHAINMALRGLRDSGAKYWLKWEDSWELTRPIISVAHHLFNACQSNCSPAESRFVHDGGRSIVDISFTSIHFNATRFRNRESRVPKSAVKRTGAASLPFWRLHNYSQFRRISSRCKTLHSRKFEMAEANENLEDWWPNFSLRPGITVANLALSVGQFDTNPIKWPFFFETIWSCRYFLTQPNTVNGFIILDDDNYTSKREADYVHTYSSTEDCQDWCQHDAAALFVCVDPLCSGCDQCNAKGPMHDPAADACG